MFKRLLSPFSGQIRPVSGMLVRYADGTHCSPFASAQSTSETKSPSDDGLFVSGWTLTKWYNCAIQRGRCRWHI